MNNGPSNCLLTGGGTVCTLPDPSLPLKEGKHPVVEIEESCRDCLKIADPGKEDPTMPLKQKLSENEHNCIENGSIVSIVLEVLVESSVA